MGRAIRDSTSNEVRLARLDKRLSAIEQRQPERLAVADGSRVRSRFGRHDDGKYGLRCWDSGGTLIVDQTA
jgi:hypothetical protein